MIFRREVYEHERVERLGRPVLISPVPFKFFACFVAAILVAIGCLLFWGSYTHKQSVRGYIIPSKGRITVKSPQPGVIVARYVKLGDKVRKGQKLYRITLQRSTLKNNNVNATLLDQYDAQLKNLHTQVSLARRSEKLKISQLKRQKLNLQVQLKQLRKELKSQRAVVSLEKSNYERYKKMAQLGIASKVKMSQMREKVLRQQVTIEELEKELTDVQEQLDLIPNNVSQSKIAAATSVSSLQNQMAQIRQQRLALKSAQGVLVRAPTTGVVSSLMKQVGQNVKALTPLAGILPQNSVLEARLLVPASAIGFIHPGESVRFRYSAFPYQQFGLYNGIVKNVSRFIILADELNLPVTENAPYYIVTASLDKPFVKIYGKRLPLTAGMTLSADIVLNHERLYRWVLRPVSSLGGHL